ncbi:aladin [Drosophila biarmipes]|uniref:aladin n=1 Tax=Drosophila biarmipes TaxID=125945 RepID=UPI0021CCD3B6|nr:aladin [Drosophila biarmipes]
MEPERNTDGNRNIPPTRCIINGRYNRSITEVYHFLSNLAIEYWNWLLGKLDQLKNFCYRPICNLKLTLSADPEILDRISQTRGWKTAAFRCLEFHPTTSLMALVTNQDIILIHDGRSTSPTRLQNFQQKDITCAAFRPWSPACDLAVGCASGIYLWRESGRSKCNIRHMLGTHLMRHLQDEGHNYVTSLQWNEDGTILISAALSSSHIILWEPDCQQKIRLIPAPNSLSPIALLRYSPDFQVLFCASCDAGASLCQLSRSKWKAQQVLMRNRIQTAVWTTCSSYLLFVREGGTRVYSCTNDGESAIFLRPRPQWRVELVVDLQQVTSCSGEQRSCGEPHSFAMDPLGLYMAVIFKQRSFVLLCLLTNLRLGSPRLLPLEFIDCDAAGEEYPTCMGFGISDQETRCLVICWDKGHIQRYLLTAKCLQEAQVIHNINR